ncbi:hypothetical protein SUGI_0016080 [Cryptomeria japonica]|nr:hypothetical protein SUGI_0016080 [Cryptomeria japonica]
MAWRPSLQLHILVRTSKPEEGTWWLNSLHQCDGGQREQACTSPSGMESFERIFAGERRNQRAKTGPEEERSSKH